MKGLDQREPGPEVRAKTSQRRRKARRTRNGRRSNQQRIFVCPGPRTSSFLWGLHCSGGAGDAVWGAFSGVLLEMLGGM